MSDTLLKTVYAAYERVKNCKACASRRKALKKRLDDLLVKVGLTEDELVEKMKEEK